MFVFYIRCNIFYFVSSVENSGGVPPREEKNVSRKNNIFDREGRGEAERNPIVAALTLQSDTPESACLRKLANCEWVELDWPAPGDLLSGNVEVL